MTSYPRPPIPANRFKTKLGPTENQTHTCDQKRGAFSLPRQFNDRSDGFNLGCFPHRRVSEPRLPPITQ